MGLKMAIHLSEWEDNKKMKKGSSGTSSETRCFRLQPYIIRVLVRDTQRARPTSPVGNSHTAEVRRNERPYISHTYYQREYYTRKVNLIKINTNIIEERIRVFVDCC